jgi:hypothetical protein
VAAAAGLLVAFDPLTTADTYCGSPALVPIRGRFYLDICGDIALQRIAVALLLLAPGLFTAAVALVAWSRRRVAAAVEGA